MCSPCGFGSLISLTFTVKRKVLSNYFTCSSSYWQFLPPWFERGPASVLGYTSLNNGITVWIRSLDPFYMVSCYIKWIKTSWILNIIPISKPIKRGASHQCRSADMRMRSIDNDFGKKKVCLLIINKIFKLFSYILKKK